MKRWRAEQDDPLAIANSIMALLGRETIDDEPSEDRDAVGAMHVAEFMFRSNRRRL